MQVWVQGFGETSDAAARLVRYARSLGLDVIVPLLMVSYLTEDAHEEAVTVLTGAGATELTLFDGPGAMSPEAYAPLVHRTRTLAPDVEVGLHPHNTFGLAVACAVAAVRAGATAVELSVNGYCGGPGNADLAATALAFEALYGIHTGISTELLTGLARSGQELTGYRTAWNHPVTGTHAFCWGGLDIITQETGIDPVDPVAVDELLVSARELMSRENRLLTDEDLVALSRELP
ncbi:hypothetical protein [Streptomyces himastatinicus]|uniref:hypothetical protein n=1 Tax=Streptomyces himastatinicus TaxID=998084 RepID=UPI0001B521AE|nr:hypothetical protein [Streptomyces himastatinicus]